MTCFRYLVLLLTGLFLTTPTPAPAQTTLGQPTLDEQKAQIWCAAARFVYDDTGRPGLKSKLNCGGSLKAFENSIRTDSQKVYSLLYQPLEARGTMYKGLGSDKSRLLKLKDEIISRLKASPSRRGSPARMQAVDALAASLTSYVENGTPPGDVSSSLNAEPTPDTSTDEATAAAPADAGPEDNPNYAPPTPAGNKDGVMSSLFAPIAFILALLSLVLFWLLRRTISELNRRINGYRKELDELKASGIAGGSAGGTFSSKRLAPEVHAEVERLVQQHVAAALAQQGSAPVAGTEPLRTAAPAPAAAPSPTPPAPPASGATMDSGGSVVSAPAAYSPPAAPHLERPLPAGPPAASPRDEFDSLVPPVQLPAPEPPYTAPAPVRYVYAAMPVNGAFSADGFREEPQPDSLYEIALDPATPDAAKFQVNPDPSVHAAAIEQAPAALRAACRYPQPDDSVAYIINDQPGLLRRHGDVWQIEQQAVVHFE